MSRPARLERVSSLGSQGCPSWRCSGKTPDTRLRRLQRRVRKSASMEHQPLHPHLQMHDSRTTANACRLEVTRLCAVITRTESFLV
eukprot:1674742-Alexandrium_andersonii.AAC.1